MLSAMIVCGHSSLVLGSASPRRARILERLGVPFEVVVPKIEEPHDDGDPVGTVIRAAELKNVWCRERYPHRTILTADTTVEFNGKCMAKPESEEQALEWLCSYSGKEQRVYTAVAVWRNASDRQQVRTDIRVATSTVRFKVVSRDLAKAYFDAAHPLDRAGAYDIDAHGAMIIAGFKGSYTNIMVLPEELLPEMLGIRVMGQIQKGDLKI